MIPKVLIIEDEAILARNICIYLEREGMAVDIASSGEAGLALLAERAPSLVLLDYNLPGIHGLEVLDQILQRAPGTRVVMMTGSGSEEVAVKALKRGAADYLKKPVELASLRLVVESQLQRRRRGDPARAGSQDDGPDTMQRRRKEDHIAAQRGAGGQAESAPGAGSLGALVGDSLPMRNLRALVARLVEADAQRHGAPAPAVLITGETGTGKELVARALHGGGRRGGPFIELNCAGIPDSLLEAELFGHERGAFTDAKQARPGLIEAANGGTLLLDEVGDLSPASQAKLLKVLEERKVRRLGSLQERPIDARILAATSRNLELMVREGTFRADLYYRLLNIRIQMPALRERPGDIAQLAVHFTSLFGRQYGRPDIRLSDEALESLRQQRWAGNVRELRNVVEQAVVLAQGDVIDKCEVCADTACGHAGPAFVPGPEVPDLVPLPQAERDMLKAALARTGSNVSEAARLLGISRDTLRYRVKKHLMA